MGTMALLVSLLFVLSVIPTGKAHIFSVDLGSESLKVGVLRTNPTSIGIALNEMSKRKSPSAVAFSQGNRLIGEEALGIAARFPERVYTRIRDMVGKPAEYIKQLADAMYLPYEFVQDESGVTSIRVDSGEVYRLEELLGMIIGYCRDLAEADVKFPVKDAVITVPPYFGQAERKAVIAAAQAAGVHVMSLMNEHAAASLQYALGKNFTAQPMHVLFYDVGANNAYAAVVYFSKYMGKNDVVPQTYFELKGVRWDADVGGQTVETRLAEHFAKEFEKQTGIDVTKVPKVMAKLKKQAKKTKEVLSANTVADVFMDSLHDDRDFKTHVSREAFEKLCSDIWDRAVLPVKKVLEDVGMTADQIDAVELLGGGTRVPKLQQVLSQALGNKPVLRHLDADEAITLGAALHAANLSGAVNQQKKIVMLDGATYGIVMNVDSDEPVVIFPKLKKMPVRLARAVKKQEDYQVLFQYDPQGELPPGVKDGKISAYKVSGLTDAVSKYSSYNLSSPIKSVLHFELARDGVFSLDRAEAVVEVLELVEVPVKNATANSTGEKAEANATDEAVNGTVKMETKLKKKTIRVPLKLEVIELVGAYSKDDIAQFRSRLEKLKLLDDEKRQTEEAKNNLESYVYATKEMLSSIADLAKVSTKQVREEFMAKLDEVGEWLYSDGEGASFPEFKKRMEELKAIGDPIFHRLEQLTARPAAVESARSAIAEAESTIEKWKSEKPWISDADVRKEIDEFKQWLDAKVSEQKKLLSHQEPAFSSADVYSRIDKLKLLVSKTGKTPKPKPPKVEKPANDSSENLESEQPEEHPEPETTETESSSTKNDENVEAEQEEFRDEL